MLSSRGLKSVSDLDLIFLRAARASAREGEPALYEAIDSSGVPVQGWAKRKQKGKGLGLLKRGIATVMQQQAQPAAPKGAHMLDRTQFVGALLRLAAQMFESDGGTLAERLTRLCEEHIRGGGVGRQTFDIPCEPLDDRPLSIALPMMPLCNRPRV